MKYVPGLFVGQLSGKAGNQVASRNKAGSYMRTRVIPKHVVNFLTTSVRANFGDNSQAYREITDEMRSAWTALGAQMTRKTSLGETIHLTGLQALQSVNRNLSNAGFPVNYTAPEFQSPPDLAGFGLSITASTPGATTVTVGANSATQELGSTTGMFAGQTLHFIGAAAFRTIASVTDATHVVLTLPVNTTTAEAVDFLGVPDVGFGYSPATVPNDVRILIEYTAPLSPGVSRPSRGQFRAVSIVDGGDTSPYDSSMDYFNIFGGIPAGSKVFVRARYISNTGFPGAVIANFVIASP